MPCLCNKRYSRYSPNVGSAGGASLVEALNAVRKNSSADRLFRSGQKQERTLLGAKGLATRSKDATIGAPGIATRGILTTSNKKLLGTSASLLVTSASLVVTRTLLSNKKLLGGVGGKSRRQHQRTLFGDDVSGREVEVTGLGSFADFAVLATRSGLAGSQTFQARFCLSKAGFQRGTTSEGESCGHFCLVQGSRKVLKNPETSDSRASL